MVISTHLFFVYTYSALDIIANGIGTKIYHFIYDQNNGVLDSYL
jgi:hypothetical protein